VAVANTLDPLLGIFANASILAQSLQLLLEGFLNWHLTVVQCLLLITVTALLPLCLLKNLDALAPYSTLGMGAVLTALLCMTIRYIDGSYVPDGTYYNDIDPMYQPQFGQSAHPWSVAALPFLCMVFTSNDMHYNASRFYAELKDASIPRFAQVTLYSFGITSAIYFGIAIVGFMTFGGQSSNYILNNYSPRDPLATVSRIAIGLCSLVSYPLNFIGVRDNCLDILGITDEIDTDIKLHTVTILLLSLLTITSCFVTDLGLINSVGGGTTVIFVCFIFPAIMFREAKRKQGAIRDVEVTFVMILMVVGVLVGIVGVVASMVLA
jgi:sodium-coupled neutral amino acid transporter 11